jgi:hypothetical protein
MTIHSTIQEFWKLAEAGKSAALDINIKTGELLLQASKSKTGEIGNGTPAIPFSDDWARILLSNKGTITHG